MLDIDVIQMILSIFSIKKIIVMLETIDCYRSVDIAYKLSLLLHFNIVHWVLVHYFIKSISDKVIHHYDTKLIYFPLLKHVYHKIIKHSTGKVSPLSFIVFYEKIINNRILQ